MRQLSLFQSAVRGADGEVDAGYLAVAVTMATTVGIAPFLVVLGALAIAETPDQAGAIIQNIGVSIGAMCTGCGFVIGAVGAFRAGDRRGDTPLPPGAV